MCLLCFCLGKASNAVSFLAIILYAFVPIVSFAVGYALGKHRQPAPPREYDQNYIMPFGKYRGVPFRFLPPNYVEWMIREGIVARDRRLSSAYEATLRAN